MSSKSISHNYVPEATDLQSEGQPTSLREKRVENRSPVLDLNSLPFASMLIGGSGACACDPSKHYHLPFLAFNQMEKEEFGEFGVEICFSHYNLNDEYLPRMLTNAFSSKRIKYMELPNGGSLNSVLYRGTHWYRKFWRKQNPTLTVKRILAVATSSDVSEKMEVLLDKSCTKQGLKKLMNAITNVDGVMQTLLLCWQGKKDSIFSSWSYVDSIIAKLVIGFVEDVIKDGEVGYESTYLKVKEVRSNIKLKSCQGREFVKEDFKGLFFFEDLMGYLNKEIETRRQVQDIAILTQRRSIGMPTPQMRLEAYKKYYTIATKRERVMNDTERSLIRESTEDLWKTVTEREDFYKVLVRCQRNEKVSLSSSADLLNSKADGGKLRSANSILHRCLPQKVFNLEDGSFAGSYVTRESIESGTDSVGQALFFHAFERFKECWMNGKGSDPILFTVQPIAVADQGKYRIATASHPLHAFLLQPIAQLLKSAFLRLPSSVAGLNKQHQAWEFYERITPEMVQHVKVQEKLIDRENFFYCEDWTSATDETIRESAAITFKVTGEALGIPRYYLQLAVWALTAPRINIINPKEKVPAEYIPTQFVSTHGILQGDPVTKNILHLMHTVSRVAGEKILMRLAEESKFVAPPDLMAGIRGNNPSSYSRRDPKLYGGDGEWRVSTKKGPQAPLNAGGLGMVKGNFSLAAKGIDPVTEEEEFKKKVKTYLLNFHGKETEEKRFSFTELRSLITKVGEDSD